MKKNINKFYADPILKEINFGGDNSWMLDLINTEEFERLGRIHQLELFVNECRISEICKQNC